MKLDSAKRKLEVVIKKKFKDEGYSYTDLKTKNLYSIELKPNTRQKYTDIYITTELTIDEYFQIESELNEIVEKVDPAAYFDIDSPGVYLARVYWDSMSADEISESIITSSNLRKLGELVCYDLEDELNETFYVDDITYDENSGKINIEVSSTVYEAKASVKVHSYDLETYQDLVDTCEDKMVNRLQSALREI